MVHAVKFSDSADSEDGQWEVTDKEYRLQRARVRKYWKKWYVPLGLEWWRVNLLWDRARDEDTPNQIGKCSSNWQYRTAEVTFNLPLAVDLNDEELEEAVVHEMTHILIAALHDFRDDSTREITEYTVTTIARSLIWAREAGQKDKTNAVIPLVSK